ncbi:MAG: hypothetical protein KGJ78_12360 [Alphaproteobacteria bacterium]|nr:hypothetical protein [Alphaproteobacteria bacterium]
MPIEIQTYADEELQGLSVLFIAGLARSSAEALAARVRLQGVLVNVEDVPELCDFHVPAIVRRGALMLTASTAGCSPGLARRLREWLSDKFGTEWEERIETLRDLREQWRAQGLQPDDISNRTRTLVEKKGWL